MKAAPDKEPATDRHRVPASPTGPPTDANETPENTMPRSSTSAQRVQRPASQWRAQKQDYAASDGSGRTTIEGEMYCELAPRQQCRDHRCPGRRPTKLPGRDRDGKELSSSPESNPSESE